MVRSENWMYVFSHIISKRNLLLCLAFTLASTTVSNGQAWGDRGIFCPSPEAKLESSDQQRQYTLGPERRTMYVMFIARASEGFDTGHGYVAWWVGSEEEFTPRDLVRHHAVTNSDNGVRAWGGHTCRKQNPSVLGGDYTRGLKMSAYSVSRGFFQSSDGFSLGLIGGGTVGTDGLYGQSISERFVVEVDLESFLSSQQVDWNWETRRDSYMLLLRDCVSFMGAIAENLGLSTPRRVTNLTPSAYVRALSEQN